MMTLTAKRTMYRLIAVFFLAQTAVMAGEQSMATNSNRSLKACPTSPNCVSSQAESSDKEHYIKPWQGSGDLQRDQQQLLALLSTMDSCEVIEQDGNYLHATFTSRWLRFVDDVEFLIDAEQIHIRSASRSGHSDFGVNRKRMEKLAQRWQKEQ